MPQLGCEGVVVRPHAVRDIQHGVEIRVDAVQLAIQQIAALAVDIFNPFQIHAGGSHIAQFHGPVIQHLALDVEKPTLAVLGFDVRVHGPWCQADGRLARPADQATLRVQAANELDVVRHRNAIQNLRADARGGLNGARNYVWRIGPCACNRLLMVGCIRHAVTSADGRLAVPERIPREADSRRKIDWRHVVCLLHSAD